MLGNEPIIRLMVIKHLNLFPDERIGLGQELQAEMSVLRLNADGEQLTMRGH